MENNFEKYFNNFLEKNSQFSQRITYMGEIHNREKLITLYKKSKFFLLTSRFDITPNVYVEA
jgi:glycosyltransferase involved in cell wall biosynthesis